jgi:hypothetical protein
LALAQKPGWIDNKGCPNEETLGFYPETLVMVTLPPEDALLSRDDFRELCLARAGGRCVFCGAPATDAHHIVERRLFPDGGYYLGNGAAVCAEHHLACERTQISVEEARVAAGITSVILPEHVYRDEGPYTKWLDQILADGRRIPGELFYDESVQRVLRAGGVLPLYVNRFKYPRTFHVPFSPGVTKDDRVIESYGAFEGQRVILTIKIDGENASIYSDGYFHARSIDTESHPSRSRARALAAAIGPQLPIGWRLCGENAFAKHSIHYQHLADHFFMFSLWDEQNICRPWDETVEWAQLLDLTMVPVLYDGLFDLKTIKRLYRERDENGDEVEGWVMRVAGAFALKDFRTHTAKFVRAGHVASAAHHWKRSPVVPNRLREPNRTP